MNQLSQISDIIEETITDMIHDPYGLHEGEAAKIAQAAAQKLVKASLEQLASLLGTSVEVNIRGETILNLGHLTSESDPTAEESWDDSFSRDKEAYIEGRR
jgi:hypothetical protein